MTGTKRHESSLFLIPLVLPIRVADGGCLIEDCEKRLRIPSQLEDLFLTIDPNGEAMANIPLGILPVIRRDFLTQGSMVSIRSPVELESNTVLAIQNINAGH